MASIYLINQLKCVQCPQVKGGSYLIQNVDANIFTYFVNVLKRSSVTAWKLVTILTFYYDISSKNAKDRVLKIKLQKIVCILASIWLSCTTSTVGLEKF